MRPALDALLCALPPIVQPFAGSEYPLPVSQAMLGELPDLTLLRQWLAEADAGELKDLCEPVAVTAELIEAAQPDRDAYFVDDDRLRSLVFQGSKWRSGWVLLAGDAISPELIARLNAAEYMIFSAQETGARQPALPPRETGAVYYLQMMVRYAMIWGQIPAGQDHEMGHFLEQDMPGAMVVRGAVGPLEGLLLLALMKMGCPAVVGPEFPYDLGARAVAVTDDDILAALGEFPNMRVRVVAGQELAMPGGADSSHARERFAPRRTLQGLLQLRPGQGVADEVLVSGDLDAAEVTVLLTIDDPRLDLPVSAYLEAQAVTYGSYLPGVRTMRENGVYGVELATDGPLDGLLLGQVLQSGLRRRYPRLGPIQVQVRLGAAALAEESPSAEAFDRARDAAILAESEASVDEFHLCIDCQPFAHSHVCVITPERPPMCGRSPNEIKAGALWGADYRPWTRRDLAGQDLQHVVAKGEAIDAVAGEWDKINAAVERLSGGQVKRVRIHAVNDAPHTSCGCFGALAFKLPGDLGIGVMERAYKGSAPGGLTWSLLANRAGGKQANGVVGLSLAYLGSPRAFAGEGGLRAVKWASTRAYQALAGHLPAGARVATEAEATTEEELAAFLELER